VITHGAVVLLAFAALIGQAASRPLGNALFHVVSWFGLALVALEVLLLVRLILPVSIDPTVSYAIVRITAVAHVLVLCFAGFGGLLVLNAILDRSPRHEHPSRVRELVDEDMDLLESVSYSWARVDSWRRPGSSERIVLYPWERRKLWGGQAILVTVGVGRFYIPWVVSLDEDKETRSRDVLRSFPAAFVAWRDLIASYVERQRWDAATAAVLEFQRHYPGDPALARYAATRLSNAGRYQQVVAVLEPVSREAPEAAVLRTLGLALAKTGRRDEGISALQRAIALEPDDYWAYNALAHVRVWGGERAEAIRLFETVLELQPGYPEAIAQLRELRGRR
jgi:tetratricopeptide (TPR) repeat protein